MKGDWIPQRIGCWPQFLWWEMDEVLVALLGVALTSLTHEWHWLILGVLFSYLYKVHYKASSVKALWKDVFIAAGIFDIPGLPKGVMRRFAD